ncbi:hypothetical protein I3760_16G093400 [Carya illinoinensis]|nr:hypothetical protein I3760_16G093400 [Carya illinoinensis]
MTLTTDCENTRCPNLLFPLLDVVQLNILPSIIEPPPSPQRHSPLVVWNNTQSTSLRAGTILLISTGISHILLFKTFSHSSRSCLLRKRPSTIFKAKASLYTF